MLTLAAQDEAHPLAAANPEPSFSIGVMFVEHSQTGKTAAER